MSTLSNIIFGGEKHYITSPYGKRNIISTSSGNTSSFHYGTDYGTNGKKLPQYAVEDGVILSCGKDSAANGYALYVWVSYPRIGKKFLHYHLDSISVKTGQQVKKGTKLGTTGMTGKATGIHLHLGIKDLKTNAYEDPEIFAKSYREPVSNSAGLYKVTAGVLNVRTGPSTGFKVKTYSEFTSNAKEQIYSLCKYKCNGYVKGVKCTVSEVKNGNWGKTPSGWICLDYCVRI